MEVNVPCIFVERNTSHYAHHFIRKYHIILIYLTIAVGNGWYLPKLLRRRVHGAAQGRKRKTLQVSKESSVVCSLNYRIDVYMTTYSYAIQPIFGAKESS